MQTLSNNWDLFCSKLEQFKQNKNGIVALCPSHNDKNPSLAASYTDEKTLVKCQAGCTFKEIVTALGMKQSQFFAPKDKILSKKIVAIYRYEDKEGKLAFSVIRFKPKDFRPQRPDGKWTLEGVARVPYRLPQILAGKKMAKTFLSLKEKKIATMPQKLD